ncbi:putative carbohydrate binding domain protein [Rosellinia necatrix]|uniref:Putative carbohydrate binding domain protein n=1 Tax=Rosellinia necatrix TaxID=77044 RepID=A0A1W2TGA6_ROSNE|nr:putative carbohydrate binding domain protein [Rosellinia necatrix]
MSTIVPGIFAGASPSRGSGKPTGSGTVAVGVPKVPDTELVGCKQTINLETKSGDTSSYEAIPGQTTTFTMPPGQYKVWASRLQTADQTVMADAFVSPTDIEVKTGETTSLTVAYGPVKRGGYLDVTVGQLSPPLAGEVIRIRFGLPSGGGHTITFSPNNHTSRFRALIGSTYVVESDLGLNNTKYASRQTVTISDKLTVLHIEDNNIKPELVDTSEFVSMGINVTSGVSFKDKSIALRLESTDYTEMKYVYTKDVAAESGTTALGMPVAPGEYKVGATGFSKDGITYCAQVADKIVVKPDGSSELDVVIRPELHGPE